MPSAMASGGKLSRIRKAASAWATIQTSAWRGVTWREGSGRERVRATAASISRSVRSFQVQPAPRIRRAPIAQPAAIQRSKGRNPAGPASAASASPHQQGMSRSQVPIGRSARERRR